MATVDPNNPIRIPTGGAPNDGTGVPLRTAFININSEFDALDDDVTLLKAHAASTSNPHGVTVAQTGLAVSTSTASGGGSLTLSGNTLSFRPADLSSIPTVGNGTITIIGSGALGGSGTFTVNQSNNASISITHDTKTVSSYSTTNPTYVITSLSFDSYGHVNTLYYADASELGGGGDSVEVNFLSNRDQLKENQLFVSTYGKAYLTSSTHGKTIADVSDGYTTLYNALPLTAYAIQSNSNNYPVDAFSSGTSFFKGMLGYDADTYSLKVFDYTRYQNEGFTGNGWFDVGGGSGGGGAAFQDFFSSNHVHGVNTDDPDVQTYLSNLESLGGLTAYSYRNSFYGSYALGAYHNLIQFLNNNKDLVFDGNIYLSKVDYSVSQGSSTGSSIFKASASNVGTYDFNYRNNICIESGTSGISNLAGNNTSSYRYEENVIIGHDSFNYATIDTFNFRNNVVLGKSNFSYYNHSASSDFSGNVVLGNDNFSSAYGTQSSNFQNFICIGNGNLQSIYSTSGNTYGSAIIIGNYNSSSYLDNITIIGYNTSVNNSNEFQLGNSAQTVYTHQAIQTRSDARDKTGIVDTALGLNFIKSLRPVDYKWDFRSDYWYDEEYQEDILDESGNVVNTVTKKRKVKPERDGSKARSRNHCGFLAQEVKETLNALNVDYALLHDASVGGGEDVLTIAYSELIAPLVKAVQELSARIEQLEQTNS